ncbi:glycosyltransferase [Flavisolibacter tropicus]|uniref:Glycosyl transferase family 1 domain-containing protein n=1 Tax=Flavisolibacter tropicus TaxID=1492898 RepID=A0A172TXF1_9BACT|nr:glycosyltransferase [Flavisolibacter tropicus]ANE51648.1 hypothetical protein SY85_15210 [Flavisolibacter tropicus]
MDGFEGYIKQLVLRMVEEQPTHQFFFLSDEPLDFKTTLPANVTVATLGSAGKQGVLQKYWLDVKLPLWLRKIKANLVINLDGTASLTTKLPQCVLLPDLCYQQSSAAYTPVMRAFYKRWMPRFLQKARLVLLPSVFLQSEILKKYRIDQHKTALLPAAVPERFQPVGYELKESVKAIFAQGQEYFLYKGPLHEDYNLVNLLKAFSFFKKRQQSSWKLVLAGAFAEENSSFQQLLETYKYKEDIVVTGPLGATEEAELVAAAYVLISPSVAETVDTAVWEAMQCGVPVLAASTATNKELFGDSVRVFDGNHPTNMAEWIMHLYRQEEERSVYIERGKVHVKTLSWKGATNTLWQSVVQAANT